MDAAYFEADLRKIGKKLRAQYKALGQPNVRPKLQIDSAGGHGIARGHGNFTALPVGRSTPKVLWASKLESLSPNSRWILYKNTGSGEVERDARQPRARQRHLSCEAGCHGS